MAETPFGGTIRRTYHDSAPWWAPHDPAQGPNVVTIVLDDLGYAALGCYGSEIATPHIDSLGATGVQFTNFHATALCSPTRASLLTGKNSHAVGMAYLSHVDDGFPGYRGRVSHHAATLAEILLDAGYNTYAVGKWHLTPMDQTTTSGPYDQWPLGRGFERWYGFHEALTDHLYPELFHDNHPVPPPAEPDAGYHLTTDLVDHALDLVTDQTSVTPEKPFFLYFALGATHTPFQPPSDYVARQRGRYAAGWDVVRERRYRSQCERGLIPPGTDLPPRNDDVAPWDDLTPEARDAYARFQEVYAAFVEHTDHEIGRLLDGLDRLGRLDNTLVVLLSDNGASQEGGPHGVLNTTGYENGHLSGLDEVIARAGEIDGRTTQVNYPLGWAQAANTPLKRYKQNTHAGGIRTPMIMRIPGGPRGVRRSGFCHVSDIAPTVLDYLGIDQPSHRRGLDLLPMDGRSIRPQVADPEAAPASRTQYFETDGNRAIWCDGWKAVAFHRRGTDFGDDTWELYRLDTDFSEAHDLAAEQPERLAALVDRWWVEAERNQVLPLDDRGFAERSNARFRPHSPRDRAAFTYLAGMHHLGNGAAAPVAGRSFLVESCVDRPTGTEGGVLLAHGSQNSGYAVAIDHDRLVFDLNYYGRHQLVRSTRALPRGRCAVQLRFDRDPHGPGGTLGMSIDGEPAGTSAVPEFFEHFIAFQGLDIGADRLSPVRQADGRGSDAFTGSFDHVRIVLLDAPAGRRHEVLD